MITKSNHKNIVKIIRALRNDKGDLFIIMENFSEGNLEEKRLREVGSGLYSEEDAIAIFN